MSLAPLQPCATPWCPALVIKGHCATHRKVREHARGNAGQRGYGARHRRWRSMVLAEHPHGCQHCHALPTDSDHADHIIPLPHPNWWDGDWRIENGQRLCPSCHNRKTRVSQS